MNAAVSPRFLALGKFRRRDVCASATEIAFADNISQCCIINPVVIEFQMWIFAILCYSWLIMIKFCILLCTRPGKTQTLLLKNDVSHEFWLFCSRHCVYIWPLWLFVSFLSFVNNSKSNRTTSWPTKVPDQIPDRFCITCVEFLLLRSRHVSFEMSLAEGRKERWLYLQATMLACVKIFKCRHNLKITLW